MAEKKAKRTKKEVAPIVPEAPVINVLKHSLVPAHRILSKEEIDQLLTKYDIATKNLPRIRADDAAVKALEGQPGDVIEIIRSSSTAGESKYYRVVK